MSPSCKVQAGDAFMLPKVYAFARGGMSSDKLTVNLLGPGRHLAASNQMQLHWRMWVCVWWCTVSFRQ